MFTPPRPADRKTVRRWLVAMLALLLLLLAARSLALVHGVLHGVQREAPALGHQAGDALCAALEHLAGGEPLGLAAPPLVLLASAPRLALAVPPRVDTARTWRAGARGPPARV